MPEQNLCPVCSTPSTLFCSRCAKAAYCSKEHQKSHWKSHKEECFPAKVTTDHLRGRILVASRDIQAGEIIFKEKPLMTGPSGRLKQFPVCLGCFRIVTTRYTCTSCKWPLCEPGCQSGHHSLLECPILTRMRIPPPGKDEYEIYDNITTLRCLLLRESSPMRWAKVLDLEAHAKLRAEKSNAILKQEKELEHLLPVNFIRETCGLKKVFDPEEIEQVAGAFRVNAFFSDDSPTSPYLFRSGTFLFYKASMTEHGCKPNAMWVIQLNSELQLRASVAIKSGESITQLYTQGTLGTFERRRELLAHHFECSCARCVDSTEFGSYLSALTCSNCPPDGYILPLNPLDDSSLWSCSSCKVPVDFEIISKSLVTLKEEHLKVGGEDKLGNIAKLEKILRKFEKYFHPNHYLIHGIENDIIQRLSFLFLAMKRESSTGDELRSVSIKERSMLAQRMISLCRKSLTIADIIWPGLSRHRGRLIYFLVQGLLVQLEGELSLIDSRKKNKKKSMVEEISPEKKRVIKGMVEEIDELRSKGIEILEIEPSGRDEYFMCKTLEKSCKELDLARRVIE